jgi:transmembrane sensor
MPKKDLNILDLLKNEYFVQWIVAPTEESNHYWLKWMSANPERRAEVQMAISLIKSSKYKIDVVMPEPFYDQVLENIVNYSIKTRTISKPQSERRWKFINIAASITLLLGGLLYYLTDASFFEQSKDLAKVNLVLKEAPWGSKLTTRLPDGSMVTLNSGSSISFPEKFSENVREISLVGEAYFEVERNPNKPFIVKMNLKDEVRVLGTSFDIKSYPEDRMVQVSVATGKVSYTSPNGEAVILLPNEMATYLPSSGEITLDKVDIIQSFGWKDKMLYFKNTKFTDIIKELERWYGVEIQANETYEHIGTFSGNFKNESLTEVLKGLSFVYQFDFTIENNQVTLTKTHI